MNRVEGIRPNVPRVYPVAAADGGVEWFELDQLEDLRAAIGRMQPSVQELLADCVDEIDEQLAIAREEAL